MKKQKENIYELLGQLRDHRRKEGRRHKLQVVILIMIMGLMSGAKGVRAITRFAKNNKEELVRTLKIESNKVPSRSVFRSVAENLEYEKLAKIFKDWAIKYVPIKENDLINIDGKAIKGTINDSQNEFQNFVSLVTVYANKRKQVLASGKIETKKESEIPKVRELIKMLDIEGVIYTLDALHCQKKL